MNAFQEKLKVCGIILNNSVYDGNLDPPLSRVASEQVKYLLHLDTV